MANLSGNLAGDDQYDFALKAAGIYEFVDEIDTFPMKFQKIKSVYLVNSFAMWQITLVSKLHCIRASQ